MAPFRSLWAVLAVASSLNLRHTTTTKKWFPDQQVTDKGSKNHTPGGEEPVTNQTGPSNGTLKKENNASSAPGAQPCFTPNAPGCPSSGKGGKAPGPTPPPPAAQLLVEPSNTSWMPSGKVDSQKGIDAREGGDDFKGNLTGSNNSDLEKENAEASASGAQPCFTPGVAGCPPSDAADATNATPTQPPKADFLSIREPVNKTDDTWMPDGKVVPNKGIKVHAPGGDKPLTNQTGKTNEELTGENTKHSDPAGQPCFTPGSKGCK